MADPYLYYSERDPRSPSRFSSRGGDSRRQRNRGIGVWPEYEKDVKTRKRQQLAVSISLLATVLFHLAILLGTPEDAFLFNQERSPRQQPVYEVQLIEPEPEEMQFVQTNPEVAQNEPDETLNFAQRNQQAAQEDPIEASEDAFPTVDGDNQESTQIVEGDLEDPVPQAPPPSPAQPQQQNPAQQAQETPPSPQQPPVEAQIEAIRPEIRGIPQERPTPPAPDFIEQEPVSEDGPGSTSGPVGEAKELPEEDLEKVIPITAPIEVQPDPVEGFLQPEIPPSVEQQQQEQQEQEQTQQAREPTPESPPMPRPRPRLRPNVVPAPLMQSTGAASRVGSVAVDAKMSEFGDYLQRMIEAVSAQWNENVAGVTLLSERPSRVKVRFTLDYQGQVSNMRVVDKTPNARILATTLCMDAIQWRSPYDVWTSDMMAILGLQQELTFTFYYR